jgi:hypothetical protein
LATASLSGRRQKGRAGKDKHREREIEIEIEIDREMAMMHTRLIRINWGMFWNKLHVVEVDHGQVRGPREEFTKLTKYPTILIKLETGIPSTIFSTASLLCFLGITCIV